MEYLKGMCKNHYVLVVFEYQDNNDTYIHWTVSTLGGTLDFA